MAERSAKIIAHRGASGYLPEHTLPAKALAYAMGADYLEQDVVASRDGQLLILHDLYLENVSDVGARFPDRARKDGHYYCVDFDLDEIRILGFGERTDPKTGGLKFPGRFPREAGSFQVRTLSEEIQFVESLNIATGRSVGIYPEIKDPAWHRAEGIDLSALMLDVLDSFGYLRNGANIFLQCFDSNELKQIYRQIGDTIPLVQLLDDQRGAGPEAGISASEFAAIADYAAGIGPPLGLIYAGLAPDGSPRLSDLVARAHAAGLVAHPYTFRADRLPAGIRDFDELLDIAIMRSGADGVFTDFPDRVAAFMRQRREAQPRPQ